MESTVQANNSETQHNKKKIKKSIKAILAGGMVTAIEWYDYALYIYFATIIGEQFFPNDDPIMSLLSTFAVFATGFAMRPLGAIFFGYIGDRLGRKKALLFSLIMMVIPTTVIGLLPTYEQIGMWAGIFLVITRLFQGLAIGGNYGGAYVFSIEHAMPGRRGIAGSSLMFGVISGFLLGAGSSLFMNWACTPEFLHTVGWRIPFLIGCIGWVISYFVHNHTSETPEFKKLAEQQEEAKASQLPIKDLFCNHLKTFFHAIIFVLPDVVGIYVTFVFMTTYLEKIIGTSFSLAMLINNLGMLIMIPVILFFGWLSDAIGRKRIMLSVAFLYCILSYPLFKLLHGGNVANYFIVQGVFAVMLGAYYGAMPAAIVEFFPRAVRYSGTTLAFNLSAAVFGGTSPWLCTWLIKITGNFFMPAFYLMLMGAITFIALIFMPDRSQEKMI